MAGKEINLISVVSVVMILKDYHKFSRMLVCYHVGGALIVLMVE